MRYSLSIFLFSILLQNIISNKDTLKRMARATIALRNIVKYKKAQMRKLQAKTDESTPTEKLNEVPSDLPEGTKRDAADTLKEEPIVYETENDLKMPDTPPMTSQKNSTTPTSVKVIQIRKFHKFERLPKSKILTFEVFLYFLNKPIARTVVLRVVIRYASSRRTLRGLDEDTMAGESVRTVCEIKPEYESFVGQNGNGNNVDYNCNAETSSDRNITEAKIDDSKKMVVGNESLDVKDIEFHEDSAHGASNLVNSPKQEIAVLNIQNVNDKDKKKLILTGELRPSVSLDNGKSYNIEFFDVESGEMKKITCQVQKSGSSCTLDCDTSETSLSTNYGNLTLSKYDTNDLYLSFNVPANANLEEPITAGPSSSSNSRTFYRKSSSGLSGGAIAGIVIACVVALAAASIAAIMLRKPAPPIDNTTVVGLKTVENI